MKIFLIGLSGVGKSSFGKKLANRFQLPFLDLDAIIEDQQKRPIPEIFEGDGEDHFRKLEESALKSLSIDQFVIACGGGTPCFYDNLEFMKQQGILIHLTLPLAVIAQRLMNSHTRPLLANKEQEDILSKLENQWVSRQVYYEQADISLDLMGWKAERMDALEEEVQKAWIKRR